MVHNCEFAVTPPPLMSTSPAAVNDAVGVPVQPAPENVTCAQSKSKPVLGLMCAVKLRLLMVVAGSLFTTITFSTEALNGATFGMTVGVKLVVTATTPGVTCA